MKPELQEEVEGDLYEKYLLELERGTPKSARQKYWYQVLNYLRPFAIQTLFSLSDNPTIMLRQNLKVSWRSLKKNKGYAWLNIGGLALGTMATMLISLWIYDEVTYDRNFANAESIASVMLSQNMGNDIRTHNGQPLQIAPVLRNEYGKYFKHVVTGRGNGDCLVSNGNKKLIRTGNFMEPGIADMLSLEMLAGNSDALQNPTSILLSESTALAFLEVKIRWAQISSCKTKWTLVSQAFIETFPKTLRLPTSALLLPGNYSIDRKTMIRDWAGAIVGSVCCATG